MDIDLAVFANFVFGWIIISTIITAMLAKRKTTTPILATVIGFLAAFLPPVSLIYIIVLVLKNDVIKNETTS